MHTANFLLSVRGRAAVAALQEADLSERNTLALLVELRRDFAAEEAGALLTLARLRRQAAGKFTGAEQLFFTPEALEQATPQPIAEYRAAWIHRQVPAGPVLDLGCGIGGDSLALARFRPVIAYELDPVRLRFAQANARVRGLVDRIEFRQADWTEELAAGTLAGAAAAFADPARRVAGRRVFGLHKMQPPIAHLLALQEQVPALGVKVAPSVDDAEVPPHCCVEFISHAGVCKEAILWFGPLAGPGRRASVHRPAAQGQDEWRQIVAGDTAPPLGPLRPSMFLHEPDPAVIRAGAFAELCCRLSAHLFDPQIAYLVGEVPKTDPLVQSFVVDEIHPFHLKQLNRRLRALHVGQIELKKRGSSIEPESLRPRLKLSAGGRPGVVILTRRGEERLMLIGRRL